MICPKCGNYSSGEKYCPSCGILLELDGNTPNNNPIVSDHRDNSVSPEDILFSQDRDREEETSKRLKIILAILCPIAVFVVIFVILVLSGIVNLGSEEVPEVPVVEESETDILLKKGRNNMEIGDYEEAETIFKAVLESDPDNEEAAILSKILHNYNRAVQKLENKKFKDARSFFDKIPIEYTNYPIKDDVEKLEDEINNFEVNYEVFEDVIDFMNDELYEKALESIELIDDEYLTDEDADLLDSYLDKIEREMEEEERNLLTAEMAESILYTYCYNMVSAINNLDFSIVEPYIAGKLYDIQKKFIENCALRDFSEKFNFVEVISVSEISSGKWKVKVNEGETIYTADGEETSEVYSWVYTIEYLNDSYYVTNIE